MKKLVIPGILVIILLALSVASCAAPQSTEPVKGPINVGAKADTEGALLQQVIVLTLRANGFQVVEKPQITGTQVIRKAIMSGELDIYPEYTGNGAFFFNETESEVWKDAQEAHERVKKLDKETNNIIWLKSAPANNTWAIAIPKKLADAEKIRTLDDFAAYVKRGGMVKLVGSEEFITSEVALPAFQKAYGFTLKKEQLLALATGNTALTEKAAAEGTDGVNAAMAYGTDGSLSALGLVVLADPRGVQPVYEPAPIVRGAVYEKYPELATILDPVFASLDLETLQKLNAMIMVEGQNAGKVAQDYLAAKKFLK